MYYINKIKCNMVMTRGMTHDYYINQQSLDIKEVINRAKQRHI